jgi:hypothetical protein
MVASAVKATRNWMGKMAQLAGGVVDAYNTRRAAASTTVPNPPPVVAAPAGDVILPMPAHVPASSTRGLAELLSNITTTNNDVRIFYVRPDNVDQVVEQA